MEGMRTTGNDLLDSRGTGGRSGTGSVVSAKTSRSQAGSTTLEGVGSSGAGGESTTESRTSVSASVTSVTAVAAVSAVGDSGTGRRYSQAGEHNLQERDKRVIICTLCTAAIIPTIFSLYCSDYSCAAAAFTFVVIREREVQCTETIDDSRCKGRYVIKAGNKLARGELKFILHAFVIADSPNSAAAAPVSYSILGEKFQLLGARVVGLERSSVAPLRAAITQRPFKRNTHIYLHAS